MKKKIKSKKVLNKAKVKLKHTCSYMMAEHTNKQFNKDGENFVEDWGIYISKCEEDLLWLTLCAYNKNNQILTQINFDEIKKSKLKKFAKNILNLCKVQND